MKALSCEMLYALVYCPHKTILVMVRLIDTAGCCTVVKSVDPVKHYFEYVSQISCVVKTCFLHFSYQPTIACSVSYSSLLLIMPNLYKWYITLPLFW